MKLKVKKYLKIIIVNHLAFCCNCFICIKRVYSSWPSRNQIEGKPAHINSQSHGTVQSRNVVCPNHCRGCSAYRLVSESTVGASETECMYSTWFWDSRDGSRSVGIMLLRQADLPLFYVGSYLLFVSTLHTLIPVSLHTLLLWSIMIDDWVLRYKLARDRIGITDM